QLDSTIDGVLLVPQQPALDVHVLEIECGLGPHDGRQFADQDQRVLARSQFQVGHWHGPIEVVDGFVGREKGRSQRQDVVCASLNVELPPARRLLKENLPLTYGRLRRVIARQMISLENTNSADNSVKV